ncbi:hypothetical protein [Sphingorhabdus sp.]|uniref:hypothetical protein n=1 Tax=Sphingorhabdus sp. TaxID=1902408 RepID=UPI0037C58DB5
MSNMRELSPQEWELVSGGTISVTGPRRYFDDDFDWRRFAFDEGNGDDNGEDYGNGQGNDGLIDEAAVDAASVNVEVKITRPLTPAEQQAVNNLRDTVARVDAAIKGLPHNASVTLSDGSVVTAKELKEAWSKTDFEVVDNNYPFPNRSGVSEADWNSGNPEVRAAISTLVNYGAFGDAGMNFFVLHEIAHFAAAQRENLILVYGDGLYTKEERFGHEREANDIARAMAIAAGIPILIDPLPGDGYSPVTPKFSTPTSPAPAPSAPSPNDGGGWRGSKR